MSDGPTEAARAKETEEEKKEIKYGVCLCGSCSFPLFSDLVGMDLEQDVRCGLCGWEGKAKEATIIRVEDWRSYMFDPEKETNLPPLPRGVFTNTLYEQVGGLSAAFADFLAKWGLLTMDDIKAPWFPLVMRQAAKAFVLSLTWGIMNPPEPPAETKEDEDKEPPPEMEEEEEA